MIKSIILFLILTTVPAYLYSENLAVSTSKDEIQLTVTNIDYGKKALTVEFELKNLSKKPIWICANDYKSESNSGHPVSFFRRIEKDNHLVIEFFPLTLGGAEVLFEGLPPNAKYIKIEGKKSFKRKILMTYPIREENEGHYFGIEQKAIHLEKVKKITISLSYFTKNLKSIEFCCQLPKKHPKDICMLDFYCGQKEPGKKISATIYRGIKKKGDKK